MKILDFNMNEKRVLVSGAGSGIGRACAIALAECGAKVILLGRTEGEIEEVARQIGGHEAGHRTVVADVSDEDQMAAVGMMLRDQCRSLDAVVANAGINGVWAPLEMLEVAEWDQTMAINLRGTFLTVRNSLPMLRANGGSVVVVSSVNGNRMFSNSGATAYACSKAAQVAFVKMVSLELAKDRIRVNAVCPGAIHTRIDESTERREIEGLHLPVEFPEGDVPLNDGQPGDPMDVANTVLFLVSDLSTHISGTEIYVDGAQSLLQG